MNKKTASFIYAFWIYTLIVIAWGAWVRISHSGNGCGDHWPLCQGEFIPSLADKKTFTEYLHRIMSGLYGLLSLVIFIFFRLKGETSKQKNYALGVLIFTITEALLGALLVKMSLVTVNDSILRLVMMTLHQVNSFILTGLVYILYMSSTMKDFSIKHKRLLSLFLAVAALGAFAALSNTLFPSESLLQGIQHDFQESAHTFIRLRILHPVLAIIISSYLIYYFYKNDLSDLAIKIILGVGLGAVTLMSHDILIIKISHLLIAHYLWSQILNFSIKGTSAGAK